MVSFSSLTSPFSNCMSKIYTCYSANKDLIVTISKMSACFAVSMVASSNPVPPVARGAIGLPFAYLTVQMLVTSPFFPRELPKDRKWLRLMAPLVVNAGTGAILGQYTSWYTWIIVAIGLGVSITITLNRKICCAPEPDEQAPLLPAAELNHDPLLEEPDEEPEVTVVVPLHNPSSAG